MSRKDYVKFAAIVSDLLNQGFAGCRLSAEYVAQEMAKTFACDNSNFDSDRFYSACGLDSEGYLKSPEKTTA